jgi:SAM-dependent methyltransferase
MLNGWKIAARTDFRSSLSKESTGETLEILCHDSMADEYDIHSIIYSSGKSDSFLSLHCDGLYRIDTSSFAVCPPPSPQEVAAHEQQVTDAKTQGEFFLKAAEALHVLPNKDLVGRVLEYAQQNPNPPKEFFLAPAISFLDLGCGNGKRVLFESAKASGECVGVDFHPPIFNDASNVSFFRSQAAEFLRVLSRKGVQVERINADFLLGKLSDPDRTFLLEKILTALNDGGTFTFSENVAVAKKAVATLKMFPGVAVSAKDFWQSKAHMELTSTGRKAAEKFLQSHPAYQSMPAAAANQDAAEKPAPTSVPASMPIVVVARKTNAEQAKLAAAGANGIVEANQAAAEEKEPESPPNQGNSAACETV